MKKIIIVFMILLQVFILTSCVKEENNENSVMSNANTEDKDIISAGSSEIVLRVGFSTDEFDPRGKACEKFKEIVEEKTNNSIKVEIYPSSKLGNDSELIAGIVNKNVDMTVSSAGNFAVYSAKSGISALPYLFTDFEDAWKFMDSSVETKAEDELTDYNRHVLAHFDNGFRCITTSEKIGGINSLEDIKGIDIRISENSIVAETMYCFGANPYISPFPKLYEALEKGKFNAQENPVPIIYNNKFYNVQKYLSITNHSYDAMFFVIREDIFQSLTREQKFIIEQAAIEAQEFNRKLIKKQTEDYIELLSEEGMIILYPDLEPFKEVSKNVLEYFKPIYGDELIDFLVSAQSK